MKKALKKQKGYLFYIEDGITFEGANPSIYSVNKRLYGNCSGLSGDCSGLTGNCTGVLGDGTGIEGDLDECSLTNSERANGVNISTLVL